MREELINALEPVLRDARRTSAPHVRLHEPDWPQEPGTAAAFLRGRHGYGQSITIMLDSDPVARVASAAEQVQDWLIGQLWRDSATNWPRCPRHPTTHPLRVSLRDDKVLWTCPALDVVIAPLGCLPATPSDQSS